MVCCVDLADQIALHPILIYPGCFVHSVLPAQKWNLTQPSNLHYFLQFHHVWPFDCHPKAAISPSSSYPSVLLCLCAIVWAQNDTWAHCQSNLLDQIVRAHCQSKTAIANSFQLSPSSLLSAATPLCDCVSTTWHGDAITLLCSELCHTSPLCQIS